MNSNAIKTTEIDITDSTVQLTDTQKAYVDSRISQGLADIKAGRVTSDVEQVTENVLKRFNQEKSKHQP